MLTLHIPGEEDPRPLEVKLLEAGENNENRSMTLDELRCIFQDPANGQPQDVEEEEEEQPEDAPEEHAAAMEALNVVPEHANDAPGDGDQGEVADENDVQMADQDGGEIELEVGERLHAPVFPEVPDIGLEGPQNDDDWLLDEDLHFEPAPRVQALPDEVPVYSSSSSSSRHLPGEAGLHTTPSEVRQMIPQRPGAKTPTQNLEKSNRWYQVRVASLDFTFFAEPLVWIWGRNAIQGSFRSNERSSRMALAARSRHTVE